MIYLNITMCVMLRLQQDQTAEEKRRQHQKELADQLNKEALERIAEGKGFKQQEKRKKSEISYRKTSEVPREPEIKDNRIFVGEWRALRRYSITVCHHRTPKE